MKTNSYLFFILIFFVFTAISAQDGILDPTFNGTGIVLPKDGSLYSYNMFMRVQKDSKIITVEDITDMSSYQQFYLKRYDIDGSLDTTFGVGGVVVSDYPGLRPSAYALDLQSDGKILIVGSLSNSSGISLTGIFISRYNSDGSLDSSFGSVGTLTISGNYLPSSFTTLTDGKMLITYSSLGTAQLSRINSNGSLDMSFGSRGNVNIGPSGEFSVQPDGKILIFGGSNNYISVTRYLSNGALDVSYGTSGTITLNIDNYNSVSSVGMQSDGKVVFIGYTSSTSEIVTIYSLIRLTPMGVLDSSFGTGGVMLLPFPAVTLEFQNDGKIVLSGGSVSPDYSNKIEVGRVLDNGNLDTSFGTGGATITSLGDSRRVSATNIKVGPDDRIVVAGTFCEAYLSCHPNSFITRYATGQLSTPAFSLAKNAFSAYPNPVNQVVNVDFNLAQSEVLSIDLFDINGRKISNLISNGNFQTGFNSQRLELPATLSRGLYFLNISDGVKTTTVKIMK